MATLRSIPSCIKASVLAIAINVVSPMAIAQSDSRLDDPMPIDEPRSYITKPGIATHAPGWLELSTTFARYQTLSGQMELERVGEMPADAGYETGGAAVYKVTNAENFYHRNQGKICGDKTILWLTVQARARSIRLGWLTLEDWRDYRPDSHGLCYAESRYLPSSPDLFDPQ